MGYFSSKTNLESGTLSRKSSNASIKSEVKFNSDILDDLLNDTNMKINNEKENGLSPNVEKDESKKNLETEEGKTLKKKHVGFYTVFHGWSGRNKGAEIDNENNVENIEEKIENKDLNMVKFSNENTKGEVISNQNEKEYIKNPDLEEESPYTNDLNVEVEIPETILNDSNEKVRENNTNLGDKSILVDEYISDLFEKDIYKDYFKDKENTCDPISRMLIFDKKNIDTMSSFNIQLDSLKLNIGNEYRLLNKWGVYQYNKKEKSFKRILIKIETHEKLERLISIFAKYKKYSSSEKKSYMLSIEGEKPKNNINEEMHCIFKIDKDHGYTAIKTILRLILDDSIHLEKQYDVEYNEAEYSKYTTNEELANEGIHKLKIFLIIFAIQIDLYEENCSIKFYIKRKGLPRDIVKEIINTFLRDTMLSRLPEKIRYITSDAKII